MKRFIPLGIAVAITLAVFWQFFTKGFIPMPASFMVAWYEPWKSDTAVNGVPTIVHKAVGDDVFRQLYPFKVLSAQAFGQGKLPLWNPYSGAGQPLLANLHPGYLNPLGLLLLWNEKLGWAWYIVLQLPLLFLATYWYARTIKLSGRASVVAATILSLSGAIVVRYIYGDYLYALIALPILLVGIERYRLLIPPATAFLLVSVQPQISIYISVTAILYALFQKKLFRLLPLFLLGAGIAAVQILPTLELWREANVTSQSSAFIFEKFLMVPKHLLSLLIPNYFGNQGTYNFWGQTDFVETAAAIGLIPVFLALLARGHVARFMASGTVITLVLSLNWFLPKLLAGLPLPVLATSIPTRLYLLTSFFLAVLAGIGFEILEKPRVWRRALGVVWTVAIIIAAGTIVAYVQRWPCPTIEVPACRMVALRNTALELAVLAVGTALLFARSRRGIVVLLVVVGVYSAAKFLPFSPPQYVMPTHPRIEKFQAIAPERIQPVGDDAIATDFASYYKFFDPNYYDPLYIRRYGELVSFVNTGSRTAGLSRSDVEIIRDATVSAEVSFRRERFFSIPRVTIISDYHVEEDPDKTLSLVFSKDFDPASSVVLEKEVRGISGTGSAQIVRYETDRVVVRTKTDGTGILVLSDNYYPDWRARVDGQDSPIYRANYTFRAVVVPQGEHEVIFLYEPASVRIGLAISLMSLVLWLFMVKWQHGAVAKR